ncbi:MAG: hypothetical protein ACFFDT_10840 [Candidatus Hodarchaeota archaeon]
MILKSHQGLPQEKKNKIEELTQLVEVPPSTACRYPRKKNSINLQRHTLAALILLLLLTILFFINITPYPPIVPPVPPSNVNPQIYVNMTYGGTGRYSVSASALIQTTDGGFGLAGYSEGFGTGWRHMWLMKTDVNGIVIWNQTYKRYNSNNYESNYFHGKFGNFDEANALIQTTDGGFALAGYAGSSVYGQGGAEDMWLVKTDANGMIIWNQTYGGPEREVASALIQTADGGFVLAGETCSFGAGGMDMWLVKTDVNGMMLWNRTFGGPFHDAASSLIHTMDGGFILVGHSDLSNDHEPVIWLVKVDSSGKMIWNQTYGEPYRYTSECKSLIQTADGNFAFMCLINPSYNDGEGEWDILVVKTDANGETIWNQTYEGRGNQHELTLIETKDGGFAIATSGILLLKTDTYGEIIWEQTFGGTEHYRSTTLIQTVDGGFALTGCFHSFGEGYSRFTSSGGQDTWLIKTDVSGVVMWERTYREVGSSISEIYALVQTTDKEITLAGSIGPFGDEVWSMRLVKMDMNGMVIWEQTYGGEKFESAYALIQTADKGFALAGLTQTFSLDASDMWLVKTDANGVMIWNQTYGGREEQIGSALIQTADGGFALAGFIDSFRTGEKDMWLVKTDANGVMIWDQTYGGTEWDACSALIQTVDGGFALTGITRSFGAGKSDMWLVKTDANGRMIWNQTYGGPEREEASTLIQTTDRGFALAGFTESFGAGERDMWLVKTDANGRMIWNQTYGGPKGEEASALIQTADGGFALAGSTDSFGAGKSDMWLVKTDANGRMIWNQTYGGPENDWINTLLQPTDDKFILAGGTESFSAGKHDMWLVITDANMRTV